MFHRTQRIAVPGTLSAGWTRIQRLFEVALASVLLAAAPAGAEPADRHILVKFESHGPHAVDECAETLFRQGRTFASGTRDGSDSLDALKARTSVRGMRALFRRPDGRPLADQRARLKRSLQAKTSKARFSAARAPADPTLPDLSHIYRVRIGDGVAPELALALYAQDPHVAWVQRDHVQRLDQLPDKAPPTSEPNDPFFASQGSWNQAFGDLWGLHRVRAPEAWSTTRGEGVVVAVVDTGLDYLHPDIAENVWVNPGEDLNGNGRVDPDEWNGIDDDGNGFIDDLRGFDFADSVDGDADGFYDGPLDLSDPDPFDDRGHGTHVAGTIAAVANNGIGIAGVAPRARIMALKGFPAEGDGLDSNLWRAVLYAAQNDARVVNASWSCNPLCPRNPLAEEVVQIVRAMGVIVVTSAGNRSIDVVSNSPENTRDVITVASSGEDDKPSESFTNFGWLVDVAAPGGGPSSDRNVYVARRNILSLRASTDAGSEPFSVGEDYARSAGTSMAAPHVSGAVALLLSAHPELDYESIRRMIRQGAVDLGPPGHDRWMGAGRLDVSGALDKFPLPDLHAALDSPRAGSVLHPGPVGTDSQNFIEIRGTARGQAMLDYRLSYGRGNAPQTWEPITPVRSAAVREGVLGRWDIGGAEPGTYLIRLEVRGAEGSVYHEFIPLSLERGSFIPLSSPGPPAVLPELSQRFLTFQSRRTSALPPESSEHLNLFVSDFLTGRQWPLVEGESDDMNLSVSPVPRSGSSPGPGSQRGSRGLRAPELVAGWNRREPNSFHLQGMGCRMNLRDGRCPEFVLSPEGSSYPVSAQGRIFWLVEKSEGRRSIHGCLPHPTDGRCDAYDLGLPPARRSGLDTDGESLFWIEFQGGQRVALCRPDPVTGACPARALTPVISPLSRVAVSGRLVAWVDFRLGRDKPLLLCEFDPQTGGCPPIEIAPNVLDPTPQLSGNRLVWDGHVGDEASDVFFCEYDRLRGRCPVQRVTAEMTPQAESAIDGRRLIWQDERTGPSSIFGTTLPHFVETGAHKRRVSMGETLKIRVRAIQGEPSARDRERRGDGDNLRRHLGDRRGEALGSETLALRVEALQRQGTEFVPVPLSALGVRFENRGQGYGRLRWRPRGAALGEYIFTFAAETRAGLVTRESILVEVESRSGRHGGRGRGRGRGRR